MKPVYSMAFQNIKAPREGNNDESDNFEMDILDEDALDKVLEGPGKTLDRGEGTWKQFMGSSMINTSNNQMLGFQNISIKMQTRVQFFSFYS